MVFSISYALKSISRRKQKNVITAIAIALGVALFIGTQAATDGIYDTVTRIDLNNQGNIDISIFQPTSINGMYTNNVSNTIQEAITDGNSILSNIESISSRITYQSSVYASISGNLEKNVGIRAIDPNDEEFGDFYDFDSNSIISKDRLSILLDSNQTIISNTLSDEMGLDVGNEIQISLPNGLGDSTTIALNVSSIFNDALGRGKVGAGPPGTFRVSQLYIHLEMAQNFLAEDVNGSKDYVTDLQIKVKGVNRDIDNFDIKAKSFPGKATIQAVMDELDILLEPEYDDLLVLSLRIIIVDTEFEELAGLGSIMTLFAIMLNGVALLLIINVQSMAVDDRKNQTAILRALGSSTRTVFSIFLIEAMIIGVLGAILGLLLGFGIGIWILSILSDVFEVEISGSGLNGSLILTAMIAGVVLSIITAVAPSLSAARLGIANSLRGIKEEKKPKKGYWTLFFGIVLFPIGLMFATQVGDLTNEKTWADIGDQITILLGFGLTLAGVGLLLTLVLSRRVALSISGISLFGVGTFFFVWALEKAKTGEGGNLFSLILLFMIVGSTLLVSVNYDAILKGVNKLLFLIVGIRAISQVTTRQMIGKKNRGVLIYTILTVILVLTIFIASAAETQRFSVVNAYDQLSDGVDIVVVTDNAVEGTSDRILSINQRIQEFEGIELGMVTSVFGFKRTQMPIYLVSPEDDNFDISEDIVSVPVIEFNETVLNPNGNWGSDSLNLRFSDLSDDISGINDRKISTNTKDSEHNKITKETFDLFFDNRTREEVVKHNAGSDTEQSVQETQQMVLGGFVLDWLHLDLTTGATVYLQATNGSIVPVYIGGTLQFDMLGNEQSALYGDGLFVPTGLASILPFDVLHENVFLVRSENGYNDVVENEALANAIEVDINNLKEGANSFSLEQNPVNLIGASTSIVQDIVEGFFFQQAGFWDFLGAFSTLGLFIGGLGMMIIAVRSVSERKREIGMMRSIGFSRKSIVYGVLIEMFVISILSLTVGIGIAVIFSENFASSLFGVKALYPMGQILSYVFGLLGIAIISGVIPGYNASKVAPSEALRYTG